MTHRPSPRQRWSRVGQLFRAAVVTASSLAGPSERGQVLATLFLVASVGLAVPSVLGASTVMARRG